MTNREKLDQIFREIHEHKKIIEALDHLPRGEEEFRITVSTHLKILNKLSDIILK